MEQPRGDRFEEHVILAKGEEMWELPPLKPGQGQLYRWNMGAKEYICDVPLDDDEEEMPELERAMEVDHKLKEDAFDRANAPLTEEEKAQPRGGPSYPDVRSIVVPPDQKYKLMACCICSELHKTETRFDGVFTCVSCQWKGLAPPKNPDSTAEYNAPIPKEEQGGKKGRKQQDPLQ
jgi:hypothetical protein